MRVKLEQTQQLNSAQLMPRLIQMPSLLFESGQISISFGASRMQRLNRAWSLMCPKYPILMYATLRWKK